jgi:uncharacterized protein (DUF488 family)
LLNAFGVKLDKLSFTKLLFLLSSEINQYYEFVLYHYGAFSFTAYSDISGLKKDNFIYEDDKFFVLQQFDSQLCRITKEYIEQIISDDKKTTLFDIGYEGKSLEGYLNLLIKNNIKILIDVRKNPISMKYGFSKSVLSKRTVDLGIKYMLIPALVIESDKRKSLNSFDDYQNLFSDYESITLKQNIKSVKEVYNILMQNKRIILTCFEANKNYCPG